MKDLFNNISYASSKCVTKTYSTSFSLGIGLLHKSIRQDVYNIYGLVRVADEIVDTFYDKQPEPTLRNFRQQTFDAIELGFSTNPILFSFQKTVNKFNIDHKLIHAFFDSMEMDLNKKDHTEESYDTYIYGSAEVVGLMCLQVFCEGNHEEYESLVEPARKLGSAFQKVNFLRDIKDDNETLGRTYFPDWDGGKLCPISKKSIEQNITEEFDEALEGIKSLPIKARFGVYAAYVYYRSLLNKITKERPETLLEKRVRISNKRKIYLLFWARLKFGLNML